MFVFESYINGDQNRIVALAGIPFEIERSGRRKICHQLGNGMYENA